MIKLFRKILKPLGYELIKPDKDSSNDYQNFLKLYAACQPYTMTSQERMYALYKAVEYVVKNNIEGDFIECGVWRGGSSMMIAKTLSSFGIKDRKIFLYDTFEGMSEPTDDDKSASGEPASIEYKKSILSETTNEWCYAPIEEVQKNLQSTGYPFENINFIKGKVEDTLPQQTNIGSIALLRLDTDWYESTKIEMELLYPKLKQNGVLIIDDYGHWEGARKAIDEYFHRNNIHLLLNRIDDTGRMAIKNI